MTFNQWLVAYEVKGTSLYPTLFDFKEMWDLNAKRFPGFNLVFCWMYVIWLPGAMLATVFCLIEGLGKWWSPKFEPKMFDIRELAKSGPINEDGTRN